MVDDKIGLLPSQSMWWSTTCLESWTPKWSWFHFATMTFAKVGLFQYVMQKLIILLHSSPACLSDRWNFLDLCPYRAPIKSLPVPYIPARSLGSSSELTSIHSNSSDLSQYTCSLYAVLVHAFLLLNRGTDMSMLLLCLVVLQELASSFLKNLFRQLSVIYSFLT